MTRWFSRCFGFLWRAGVIINNYSRGEKVNVMKKILLNLIGVVILIAPGIAGAVWELEAKFDPKPQYERFRVKIKSWDFSDQSWNPLYNCASGGWADHSCRIFMYYSGPQGGHMFGDVIIHEFSKAKTLGEVGQLLERKGYMNYEFLSHWTGSDPGQGCFYLAHVLGPGHRPLAGGPSTCTMPEIVPAYCNIDELSVNLDHGQLTANNVNGHMVSRQIHVRCNQPYKASIRSTDQSGTLFLGNGLKSELKANGVDIGQGYTDTFGATPSAVTLTSTLSGYVRGEGQFQGSKVIMLTLP